MKLIIKKVCFLGIIFLLGGCCAMPYQPTYIVADKDLIKTKEACFKEP